MSCVMANACGKMDGFPTEAVQRRRRTSLVSIISIFRVRHKSATVAPECTRRQTGCQPAHGTVPFTRMFRIKARNGNTSRSSVLYDCFRISNAALCAFTGAWTDNNRSHTNLFNRLGVHALLNVFTMFSVQRPDATCSTRTLPASDPYFFFSFFPHQMADCGFLFPFPT